MIYLSPGPYKNSPPQPNMEKHLGFYGKTLKI